MSARSELRLEELAHQLSEFRLRSPSPLVQQFDKPTVQLIEYLAETRPSPSSTKNVKYPPDWDLQRSELNRAVAEFLRLAESQRIPDKQDFHDWANENRHHLFEPAYNLVRPLGRASSRSRSRSSSLVSNRSTNSKDNTSTKVQPGILVPPTSSIPPTPSTPSVHPLLEEPPTVRLVKFVADNTAYGRPRKHFAIPQDSHIQNVSPEGEAEEAGEAGEVEELGLLIEQNLASPQKLLPYEIEEVQSVASPKESQSVGSTEELPSASIISTNSSLSRLTHARYRFRFKDHLSIHVKDKSHGTDPVPAGNMSGQASSTRSGPSLADLLELMKQNQERTDQLIQENQRANEQRFARFEEELCRSRNDENSPRPSEQRNSRRNSIERVVETSGSGYWKTDDIGYFWPDMSDDVAVKQQNNATYYKDVNIFCDRIRGIIDYKGEEIVKSNIQACLRGAALSWFTSQLTDLEKVALRTATLEVGWLASLSKRFKPNPQQALQKLNALSYGYKDVQEGKTPQSFAEEVIRLCRAAEITSSYNQMSQIWTHLEAPLQRDVPLPKPTTSLAEFLQDLEERQFVWQNITANFEKRKNHHPNNHGPRNQSQSRGMYGPLANHYGSYPQHYQPNGFTRTPAYGTPAYAQAYPAGAHQQAIQPYQPQPQSYSWNRGGFSQNRHRFANNQSNHQRAALTNGQQQQQSSNPQFGDRQPWNQNRRGNVGRFAPGLRAYATNTNYGEAPIQLVTANSADNNCPASAEQTEQTAYQVDPFDPGYGFAEEAHMADNLLDDSMAFYSGPPTGRAETIYDESESIQGNYTQAFAGTAEVSISETAEITANEASTEPLYVISCRNCLTGFPSKNKLHQHLATCKAAAQSKNSGNNELLQTLAYNVIPTVSMSEAKIIESNAINDPDITMLRSFRSATALVGLNTTEEYHEVCLDSGCSWSVGNAEFLRKIPGVRVETTENSITVAGILGKQKTKQCAVFSIFLPSQSKDGNKPVFGKIQVQVTMVEGMRPNILIGTDTMIREGGSLDFVSSTASFRSCSGLTIPIVAQAKPHRLEGAPVYATKAVVLGPHTKGRIPVKVKAALQENRDFIFEPTDRMAGNPEEGIDFTIHAHLVDQEFSFVEATNRSNKPVTIGRHARLGTLADSEYLTAYAVDESAAELAKNEGSIRNKPVPQTSLSSARQKLKQGSDRQYRKYVEQVMTDAWHLAVRKDEHTPEIVQKKVRMELSELLDEQEVLSKETVILPNGVTVYAKNKDPKVIQRYQQLVDRYDIWGTPETIGIVNIPEDQWLEIPLKDGWEKRIPRPKIYKASPRDREVIDKTFDLLVEQGKLEPAVGHTPSGYPVFVVWKTVWDPQKQQTTEKGRVVIDLRGANRETEPDQYPIPVQEDILALVRYCFYISVIDACRFFYQWPVRQDHRNRLAVVSHRGQEIFNVAIMGFINSVPFVQRQMDMNLKEFREFCRAYVDDVVTASQTLDEHIEHLSLVFERLESLNIKIEPSKAFLGFPSVKLLGQRVDALGLTTPAEKLEAILALKFPQNLQDLETYLGLTSWFRHYIEKYAIRVKPLQSRKNVLLRNAPKGGPARKEYARTTNVADPTGEELAAFDDIQSEFKNPRFLVHFDKSKQLYADLDASYLGMGVMVYHLIDKYDHTNLAVPPSRTNVQPVLFLSRLLKSSEANYWPTELEVACLVWMLRKIRHLVEAAEMAPVIYTDHSSTVGIAKQSSFNTVALERLNLRLVRASQFIQQFRLVVYHRPGNTNTVADALSRLPRQGGVPDDSTPDLDSFWSAFPALSDSQDGSDAKGTISMIKFSNEFEERVKHGYDKDHRAKLIIQTLTEDPDTKLPYSLRDGILYMTKRDVDADGNTLEEPWLYLPRSMAAEVFRLIHDDRGHQGIDKCLHALYGITIYQGRRLLRKYVQQCPTCNLNKPRHHKPYGSLQPITPLPVPFDCITMDFISALPVRNEHDSLLVVVDKFSKRIGLIPGSSKWTAEQWGETLVEYFKEHDWGYPRFFISDRDPRFLSKFWKGMIHAMKATWYYSTAFHPQTDGQSERMIQVVEIMIRHAYTLGVNDWHKELPTIIASINSSPKASKETPHKLLFGIELRQPWNLMRKVLNQDFSCRLDAEEALNYAAVRMKLSYDRAHKLIEFNVGDYVYIRLHKGYHLPAAKHPKIAQQYAGPFKVLERIGRLAYRLELPRKWKIHPVISVAQLEPAGHDTFGRHLPKPPATIDERFPDDDDRWEIDRILDKRVVKLGRNATPITQYLIRWMGYGAEDDEWIATKDLEGAEEAIQDYESCIAKF